MDPSQKSQDSRSAVPVCYLALAPGMQIPEVSVQVPFRAVVIIEHACIQSWQAAVSEWLVHAGCLWMMAWGVNCSSWDDSVDLALLERFDCEEIPDQHFVMTTWHEDEPLAEVFWFSKNISSHPVVEINQDLLLHITDTPRASELLRAYAEA